MCAICLTRPTKLISTARCAGGPGLPVVVRAAILWPGRQSIPIPLLCLCLQADPGDLKPPDQPLNLNDPTVRAHRLSIGTTVGEFLEQPYDFIATGGAPPYRKTPMPPAFGPANVLRELRAADEAGVQPALEQLVMTRELFVVAEKVGGAGQAGRQPWKRALMRVQHGLLNTSCFFAAVPSVCYDQRAFPGICGGQGAGLVGQPDLLWVVQLYRWGSHATMASS